MPLGSSGETVAVETAEDRSHWIGDRVLADGDILQSASGNDYVLTLADGSWTASYIPETETVVLGVHGGTITIATTEDGGHRIGDTQLESGLVVEAALGNEYVLTTDSDGAWISAWIRPAPVTVSLGRAATISLQRLEDGSWKHGEEPVEDGSLVGVDGLTYRLELSAARWSATFQPTEIAVGDTGLTAILLEDRSGYDVAGTILPASGTGDVEVGGGHYRVWMESGTLDGVRFQAGDIRPETGDWNAGDLEAGAATTPENDEEAPYGDARTTLAVDGLEFPFGELLGTGVSRVSGVGLVAEAKQSIQEIRRKAEALLSALSGESSLPGLLDELWNASGGGDIEDALERAFGESNLIPDAAPDEEDILAEIDLILASLSSAEALGVAAQDGGALAGLDDDTGTAEFEATASESVLWFGVSGAASYGALSKRVRGSAGDEAEYSYHADAEARRGTVGAFAYATIEPTARTSDISHVGGARYVGSTVAVSEAGVHFAGDIALEFRFGPRTVTGRISNLRTQDGAAWERGFIPVSTVELRGRVTSNAQWNETGTASIQYASAFGGAAFSSTAPQTFQGTLLGVGDAAGIGATGTWSVGSRDSADFLAGGFGAVRSAAATQVRPPVDDGTGIGTTVLTQPQGGSEAMTEIAEGQLRVNVPNRAWSWPEGTSWADDRAAASDPGPTYLDGDRFPVYSGDDGTRTFTMDLASLHLGRGAERSAAGKRHVDLAWDALERVRGQLRALVSTDQLEGAQAALWSQVSYIVGSHLFGWDDLAGSELRTAFKDGETALGLLSDVLHALSTRSALARSLDQDNGGIFTKADGTPFSSKDADASDNWQQLESEVLAWLDSTDYTRFGIWRLRTSRNSDRDDASGADAWENRESDTFAYSPLQQTAVTSFGDPSYFQGSTATYQGETLAWKGPVAYEGSIELTVEWATTSVSGSLFAVLSGLVSAELGDPVDLNGTGAPGGIVRELVFRGGPGGIAVRTDDNGLMFDDSNDVSVTFADRTAAFGTAGNSSIRGVFVGSTREGPLGVLGQWEAGGDVGMTGAFGAELP